MTKPHGNRARDALVAVALAAFSAANAQDGLYDDRFGNYLPGRTVYQAFDDDLESAAAIGVAADGSLILAGGAAAFRLSASGLPDASFGSSVFGVDGLFVVQPFGENAGYLYAMSVGRQPDGKLLLSGWAEDANFHSQYVVCRTSADGVLDASYGEDGCASYVIEAGSSAFALSAAVDAGGRVVVGGYGNFSFGQRMVVVRFDADGHLDISFGTNGRTVLLRFAEIAGADTTEEFAALTLDASGRVIVVGTAVLPSDRDFAVARLDANGRLDTSFGDGGARLVDVAGAGLYDAASSVALQRSGRIIVGGHAVIPNGSEPGMTVVALTPQGSVDASFGNPAGHFIVWPYAASSYAYCYGVAVQRDDRIVMAGYTLNTDNLGAAAKDMAIVRLMPNGDALDGTFATFGVFTDGFNFGSTDDASRDDRLLAVALQDDHIVAVGGARDDWPNESFVAIRLTQDRLFVGDFELP
ncbi:MAG: hypothetical protein ABW186_11885 [Rhodanobacteraceae bacterium]